METVFTLALFSLLAFLAGMFWPGMVLCRNRKRVCLLFASLFAVSVVMGLQVLNISPGDEPSGVVPEAVKEPGFPDSLQRMGADAGLQPECVRVYRFSAECVPGVRDSIGGDSAVSVWGDGEVEACLDRTEDFFSSNNFIKSSLK